MSNITIIYNRIVEVMASTFPDRTRIPNAYSLQDNDHMFLRSGYGIKVGSSSQSTEYDEFCSRNTDQEIAIVFTEDVLRLDSDEKPVDDFSLVLLEAVNTVQDLFFSYNELDIQVNIAKIDIAGTTPIEPILGNDGNKFLSIETSFLILIKERV